MKYLIWGTGKSAKKLLNLYNFVDERDILAFIDNSEKKIGTHLKSYGQLLDVQRVSDCDFQLLYRLYNYVLNVRK